MPIEEVAVAVGMSVPALRIALNHISDLGYETIRHEGLEILFRRNESSEGRKIGFLVDGWVGEILDLDAAESQRLAQERSGRPLGDIDQNQKLQENDNKNIFLLSEYRKRRTKRQKG